MAISRQLDTIGQAPSEVMHEMVSGAGIPRPNHPARNELSLGIKSGPSPDIPKAPADLFWAGVLLFTAYKTPNFIALDPLAVEIAKFGVLIRGTGGADLTEKLYDGVFNRICDPSRGSD